jgi:hypothetical protein
MPSKQALRESFSEIGVKEIARKTISGHDVLFADGFVVKPFPALKKFGVEEDQYPNGCYATVWLLAGGEDAIGLGLPIFFDPMHNVTQSIPTRQVIRLQCAENSAVMAIQAMKDARKNAN